MSFFEVKTIKKEGKKYIKAPYLVKAEDLLSAYSLAGVSLAESEELEFLAVAKKDVIDVFTIEAGGSYFEVKIEFDSLEGDKVIKETYIQQALELSDVKQLLLKNITGAPEFKSIIEKNYIDYFKE